MAYVSDNFSLPLWVYRHPFSPCSGQKVLDPFKAAVLQVSLLLGSRNFFVRQSLRPGDGGSIAINPGFLLSPLGFPYTYLYLNHQSSIPSQIIRLGMHRLVLVRTLANTVDKKGKRFQCKMCLCFISLRITTLNFWVNFSVNRSLCRLCIFIHS